MALPLVVLMPMLNIRFAETVGGARKEILALGYYDPKLQKYHTEP